jgi:gamma-glutamyltranspeptidase / glutathione hydrolase
MTRTHLTGTSGGESAAACLALFDEGASAVDVALAHALAQITLASGAWVSFAGILGMTYYEAATGVVHDLNAEYDTVAGERDPMSIPAMDVSKGLFARPEQPHRSGRTVLVPGFMAGVQAAHDRFGRLPFARIFDPAIDLAEGGFPFSDGLKQGITHREAVLAHWPETRRLFQRADGSWLEPGDDFRQPELAETLRAVANKGAAHMYTGTWAEELVRVVQEAGGALSLDDLAAYEARWTTPLTGTYGGRTIHAHGAPATGGVSLLEALSILEVSGIHDTFGHYADSPDALYLLAQITRAFQADHLHGAGGPDPATRLTREHAERVWARIQEIDAPYGPQHILGGGTPKHSDALVAVDAEGNICAITHSINCVTYGEFGRFVGGVSIPDSASFQQAAIAAVGPGQRLPSPLEVGIVTEQGEAGEQAVLGFASIGAGLHHKTVTCLYNVLQFGMDVEAAQAAPSLGGQPPSAWTGEEPGAQTVEVGKFDQAVLAAAARNGITFVEDEYLRGAWVASQIDPDGRVHGTEARISKPRGVSY